METGNKLLDEFLKELSALEDSRRSQGQRHKIEFVIMITIFATMSGYLGYRAIGDFIKKHQKEIVELFKPAKGRVPSFSCVRRVLLGTNFKSFVKIYKRWLNRLDKVKQQEESSASAGDSKWHSIDGKAIRGANKIDSEDSKHLVSIFSSFKKIVVDVDKVENKSNEIPCVQKLIQATDLEGVIKK